MKISLFSANGREEAKNSYYLNSVTVSDTETFRQAVSTDYVCASFVDSKRSIANFIKADCCGFDCDNTHSDDPAKWVTP